MRMLAIAAAASRADVPAEAVVCHDVRDPAQRSQILARKGTLLQAHEIMALLERNIPALHLAVPAPEDRGENGAAERLAAAVAGPGVECGTARYGQISFQSQSRGLLRVHASRLDRINEQPDVLLLTAESDRPVETGTTLGVVKCAPVFLPEHTLQVVETLSLTAGPVLEVISFRAMRVAFVAPRERLRGTAFDRACAALSSALEWYGSALDTIVGTEASVAGLAAAYRQALAANADLVLAAGAAGTDPLDVVFEGLRSAGGEVDQIGIPAEPGTACWIGHLEPTMSGLPSTGDRPASIPVLGLASCELFGQPGALDLLLPHLLTGESLDRRLLRRLALGGLLMGPSRVASYHARIHTAD